MWINWDKLQNNYWFIVLSIFDHPGSGMVYNCRNSCGKSSQDMGHRVKVKVTGAKRALKSLFLQCKLSVSNVLIAVV